MGNPPISYQWEAGSWLPADGIPLSDRAVRHGISVFETIGIADGRLTFLMEHLAKLRQAVTQMGLAVLPETLGEVLSAMEIPFSHGVARLTNTAGDGNLRDPLDRGRLFLTLESRSPIALRSLRLRLHPQAIQLPFPSLKTGNYWLQIQALQEATRLGCDETVLLNPAGHVVSAATANLFAVVDDLLITPRTASGARAGVLRDWVLQNAEVVVCDFHASQLQEATEIFLTSSGIGIASVALLEARALPQTREAVRLQRLLSPLFAA